MMRLPYAYRRKVTFQALWPWLPFWLLIVFIAIFQHGPMPMYSTRTLSVSWEMWQRHSFLVPYLNGEPYSDKPPLLLWLIQIGWWISGVGDVWPRVLEVALGGTELVLLAILAHRLFPAEGVIAKAASWMLLAFTYGFLFGLQVMYEVLLAVCVLAALLALVPTKHRESPRFVWFAMAVGCGLLTKGPVMLLHVAFPWLLGPLWNDWARRQRCKWYLRGSLAFFVALMLLLAWAFAAASTGGASYREQLLFHQTAGRVVHSFAHAEPFWWYLAALPVLIFPFALWPRLWVAISALRPPFEPGLRFVLAWLGPVVLTFSFISGKQLYYLLPEYAGFALLLSAAVCRFRQSHLRLANTRLLGPWPLAVVSLALAAGLMLLPHLVSHGIVHNALVQSLAPMGTVGGVIFALLALALLIPTRDETARIAVVGLIGALTANGLFSATMWPAFDMRGASALLAYVQSEDRPIANLQSYDGQFHFFGRLTKPIVSLHDHQALVEWATQNPNGLIISYPSHLSDTQKKGALYVQPFRGVWLTIWAAPKIVADHADQWSNSSPDEP
jgi:4-amino-4-deoxy-L-arabinose transferase-like glycosyltransferase